jgi:aminoglycoside phosphotransferase (APT) family kinase protein
MVVDKASDIRPGEEIDTAAVAAFLKDRIPDLNGPLEISQFPSGFSNLTYEIRSGSRQMVLRRPPIGAKVDKGHDMEREFRVLEKVHQAFALCPAPLAYADDPALIGAPFFVMEKLSGIILRKDLPEGIGFSPDQAQRLCKNLTDLLVEIHAIDMDATGLSALGKPQGYVARQVTGWSGRYQKARTDDAPDFQAVMDWLAEKQPKDTDQPTMVHNDYKMDNLVLDPDQPDRIIGVLDWEMATYGDPLMDLGNSLAYWVQADDPEELQAMRTMPTHILGALTRDQIIARYGQKTGRDVSCFDFYYCFGLFRLAVIAQQIYNRYFHGLTKNKRFAMLIFGVHALEKTALALMEKSRL